MYKKLNKYLKIELDKINKVLELHWTDDTIFMNNNEYLHTIKTVLETIEKEEINYLINNMINFKNVISIDLHDWIQKNFFTKLNKLSFFKKIAIIKPVDYTSELSVKFLLENNQKKLSTITIKLFENIGEAETWIFFNK